jgi:SAM-dependent methyltransferase
LTDDTQLDEALRRRLEALCAEGWELWSRFDMEVRQETWHSFVAADYDLVHQALLAQRGPGLRFLELGSATGVITIMADLLGYEAYGIELDADLARTARDLAKRNGSAARFATGSFLPSGYRAPAQRGDERMGTIGEAESAYPALGRSLDDFEVVFGFPWDGEEAMMLDLMATWGRPDARLLLHSVARGVEVFRGGKLQS